MSILHSHILHNHNTVFVMWPTAHPKMAMMMIHTILEYNSHDPERSLLKEQCPICCVPNLWGIINNPWAQQCTYVPQEPVFSYSESHELSFLRDGRVIDSDGRSLPAGVHCVQSFSVSHDKQSLNGSPTITWWILTLGHSFSQLGASQCDLLANTFLWLNF